MNEDQTLYLLTQHLLKQGWTITDDKEVEEKENDNG